MSSSKKFDEFLFNDAVMYRHIFSIPRGPSDPTFDEHGFFAKMASYGVHGADAAELLKQVDEAIAENVPRKKFVVSYMHYTGENYDRLTSKQKWWVYCKADGYGYRRASELRKINEGWDFSHIRDSTIDGWKRMEKEIKKWVK